MKVNIKKKGKRKKHNVATVFHSSPPHAVKRVAPKWASGSQAISMSRLNGPMHMGMTKVHLAQQFIVGSTSTIN